MKLSPNQYFNRTQIYLGIYFLFIGLFYLAGEPISPHLHRCNPFAVLGIQLQGLRPCRYGNLDS